jgi:hypothetical protein
MAEDKTRRDPVPEHFDSIEAVQDFWDTHSLADYDDVWRDVELDVDIKSRVHLVALESSLAEQVAEKARTQGLTTETLVNLWIAEKLRQAA